MNNLLIKTPQNVNLEYKLASLGSRILAFMIDTGIIILYIILAFNTFSKAIQFLDSWSIYGFISLITLPAFLYPLLCETFMQGQTIGKRVMKIKVVKIDGTRATLYQYFIRWVSSLVDVVISMGGIGMTSIILSKNSQRIGDIAAETAVISIKNDLTLKDTLYQEITKEHHIVYPEVIVLTDQDINTVKEVYGTAFKRKNYQIIQELAKRLEEVMKINADTAPQDFISQIIKDHYYIFREQ